MTMDGHDPLARGPIARGLLDGFQRDLPLVPRPYAAMAERLGTTEETVIDILRELAASGALSRVGAILPPHRFGASTLAAMAVPPERLDAVAALVNGFDEVNHNYEREHRLNLWFVVAAPTPARVDAILDEIRRRSGLPVIDLPLLEPFRIDLGFPLQWT